MHLKSTQTNRIENNQTVVFFLFYRNILTHLLIFTAINFEKKEIIMMKNMIEITFKNQAN